MNGVRRRPVHPGVAAEENSKPYFGGKDIMKKTGLPQDISRIERLGRLKRIHDFSLQDIREAIRKLQQDS